MVGPISDDERRAATRMLSVGFALLVALSAGMTAFYGGATPVEIALVTAVGLLAGAVLLVVLGIVP